MTTRRLPSPDLVFAARQGGKPEMDALIRAWLPHVYRWCFRLGGPHFEAEDAAHEAVMLACRKFSTLEQAEAFPAWLYGITKRVIANHRKRAWFRKWVPGKTVEQRDPRQDPHLQLQARRDADQVWQVLDGMTAHQREVLILCELEERTNAEVAALLGIPLGTVKSRLRAAREVFRSQVGSDISKKEGVG